MLEQKDIEVVALRSIDDLMLFSDEWDSYLEETGGDIYLCSKWISVWWKFYGKGIEFHGLIIRNNRRVIAVFPLAIETLGIFPLQVRFARFAGSFATNVVLNPKIIEEFTEVVCRELYRYCFELENCDFISFTPLAEESEVVKGLALIHDNNNVRTHANIIRKEFVNVYTIFRLPGDFNTYFEKLSRSTRKEYRQSLRNLGNLQEISEKIHHHEHALARFDTFVALHQQQWQAVGASGHFGDWPSSYEFNLELTQVFSETDQVRFYELWRGDALLAAQFYFLFSSSAYFRLPARVPDHELERNGIGRTLLIKSINHLIDENVYLVEAGHGHYDYKVRHGGIELNLLRIVSSRSSIISVVKTRLLLFWADFINSIYYRGWFLKLSYKVNIKRRPLWHHWIKTRW